MKIQTIELPHEISDALSDALTTMGFDLATTGGGYCQWTKTTEESADLDAINAQLALAFVAEFGVEEDDYEDD